MPLQQPREFLLCADDYALSPGVSRAIVALLERGRLSATSALVLGGHWREHARWIATGARVGLHLALTDFPAARDGRTLPTLAALAKAAYLRRIPRDGLSEELSRQFDAFESAMRRRPDFVDGHKHVHLLPQVREALLDTLDRRYGPQRPWLRLCDEPLAAIAQRGVAVPRAVAISLMSRPLRRQAMLRQWPANGRFAGVRSFREGLPYRTLLQRFIAAAPQGLLVMCHPGADDGTREPDPIAAQRAAEFSYLSSPDFPEDLNAANAAVIAPD